MRRYVITGAPGTGKTMLVQALGHLGDMVGEPARELIEEHRRTTGEQTLDGSPGLFVERLIARSIEKYESVRPTGVAIYDRGLPDCVAYAATFDVSTTAAIAACAGRRYTNPVFVAPPWEAIYTVDDMRRAAFDEVTAFHEVIITTYEALGYELVELPKLSVAQRVEVVTNLLNGPI